MPNLFRFALLSAALIIFQSVAFGQFFKLFSEAAPVQRRVSVNQLDLESQQCMKCHDGSRATKVELRPAGSPLEYDELMRTTNHPVGIEYTKSYQKNPKEYVHPSALNPSIKLFAGAIGCLSCHVSKNRLLATLETASPEPTACTVDVEATQQSFQGSLCVQCHVK